MTPAQLLAEITAHRNILLISHANPDGDTLGSTLALAHFLQERGVAHDLFCADTPASYFNYLPGINRYLTSLSQLDLKSYDAFICLDHGSLKQSKVHDHLMPHLHNVTCINIDHHITNERFGTCNYIQSDASSTCEVMYDFFVANNISISRPMATCLMTGIITDTGNFTNSATRQSSLNAASHLVRLGAKIPEINQHVIKSKNIPSLNVWGEVFSRLTINPTYGLAYTVITHEDLEHSRVQRDALDGLVNFLNNLEGVRCVMLLIQESPELIKGSLRTTRDDVDVAKLAALWGGGGHKKAAGFQVQGTLTQTPHGWQVA